MKTLPPEHKKRIQEVGFLQWMNEQFEIQIKKLTDDLASGSVKIREVRFRSPKQYHHMKKGTKAAPGEKPKAQETPIKKEEPKAEPPKEDPKKTPPPSEKKERGFFDELGDMLGMGEE